MAATGAKRQKDFRDRQRVRKHHVDGLAEKIKATVASEMQIDVQVQPWGIDVEWTFSRRARSFLEAYAKHEGISLDDMLDESVQRVLNVYVKRSEREKEAIAD